MTHSEFFLKSNYDLWEEMVIYDYFQKKGLDKCRKAYHEWRRYAERALIVF